MTNNELFQGWFVEECERERDGDIVSAAGLDACVHRVARRIQGNYYPSVHIPQIEGLAVYNQDALIYVVDGSFLKEAKHAKAMYIRSSKNRFRTVLKHTIPLLDDDAPELSHCANQWQRNEVRARLFSEEFGLDLETEEPLAGTVAERWTTVYNPVTNEMCALRFYTMDPYWWLGEVQERTEQESRDRTSRQIHQSLTRWIQELDARPGGTMVDLLKGRMAS